MYAVRESPLAYRACLCNHPLTLGKWSLAVRALLLSVLTAQFLLSLPSFAQAAAPSSSEPAVPVATFDLNQDRLPVSELKGQVRFHLGDNSGWARPEFDDSKWPLIEIGQYWKKSGISDPGGRGGDGKGMGWYRFHVRLPRGQGRQAIYIQSLDSACQIYANGEYVGQAGFMPPHEQMTQNTGFLLPLPELQGDDVVIAVRFWHWAGFGHYMGGGFAQPPMLGDAGWLSQHQSNTIHSSFWDYASTNFQILLAFVSGVIGLGLFQARRREREYLYFAASQLLSAAGLLLNQAQYYLPVTWFLSTVGGSLLYEVSLIFWLQFLYSLMGARRDRWFWMTAGAWLLDILLFEAPQMASLPYATWIGQSTWLWPLFILITIPQYIAPVIVLARGARRRNLDGILLLIPVSVDLLAAFIDQTLEAGYWSGLFPWAESVTTVNLRIAQWPFPITIYAAQNWIELLFVLIVLVLRFARTRRDEERMRGELEAARAVQQMLVPDEIPTIPGFAIQAIYHPAGEVGGDFYQVLPTSDGGLLAVIGDVSGKGMPAAMTVSLLVGTVRTLAHYTQDPAEILAAMNQRMIGRANGGFATALALRLERDGMLTAANAGHISPYANGRELEISNSLPLGITASAAYSNSTLHLETETTLTLLSDGVVEAQNAKGELFGFERMAAISSTPADEIVHAARQFGQQDDITVLSLSLVAAGSPAMMRLRL
jgi:hypothetical protein